MIRIIALLSTLMFTHLSWSGFLGAGQSFTTSATFDEVENGLRVDFGSESTSWLDLEWNYVDFGTSEFNDPDFIPANEEEDTSANFENIGFGDVNRSQALFTGIQDLHTQGIGAGLKFKKIVNTWFTLYARASFLAWQADTTEVEIYGPRDPVDSEGDPVAPEDAFNKNPCNDSVNYCRRTFEGKSHWGVDFWYGYGFMIQPVSWLSVRTEYAITELSAIDFPAATFEGINTSIQIHF